MVNAQEIYKVFTKINNRYNYFSTNKYTKEKGVGYDIRKLSKESNLTQKEVNAIIEFLKGINVLKENTGIYNNRNYKAYLPLIDSNNCTIEYIENKLKVLQNRLKIRANLKKKELDRINKYGLEQGHVYVIQDNMGRIKIGKSINPTTRINQIRTASGITIKNKYVTKELLSQGYIEKRMHEIYADNRTIGEWFEGISFKDVITSLENELTKDDWHINYKKYKALM